MEKPHNPLITEAMTPKGDLLPLSLPIKETGSGLERL